VSSLFRSKTTSLLCNSCLLFKKGQKAYSNQRRTLQLQSFRLWSTRWSSTSTEQGATGIQVSWLADNIFPREGHLEGALHYRMLTCNLLNSYTLRQIFFEMGFTEMPTNQYVESEFWVCDSSHLYWVYLSCLLRRIIPFDFVGCWNISNISNRVC
jgi:hypothetical protein